MAIEEYLGIVKSINIDEKLANVRIKDLKGKYSSVKFDGEELYKNGAYFKGAKIKFVIKDKKTEIVLLNPEAKPAEKIYKVPPIVKTVKSIRKKLKSREYKFKT